MRTHLGIIGSLALHLLLLISFVPMKCSDTEEKKQSAPNPTLLSRQAPTFVTLHQTENKGNSSGIDPRICGDKGKEYKGIGILHNLGSLQVIHAPEQYPAYRAGVRVGDTIQELYKLPGQDIIFIRVLRNGKSLSWKIPMEKICFA